MINEKETIIREIVDTHIRQFAGVLETRYSLEVTDPLGVINSKKNNAFMSQLGEEFMFYSAFVRSFDSSFGKVLENMGNAIAKISYTVRGRIESYLLPQQTQHIDYLMTAYEKRDAKPKVEDYLNFNCLVPSNITSFITAHETDNYFYDEEKHCHYLIELKAGGDLDNKKAKSEKIALLNEFFILKNFLQNKDTIRIYFATAYNKFGEGIPWKQERVQTFFAGEELLIGRDYWNFVCNDPEGYNVIFDQYRCSSAYIKNALDRIKQLYFS
ncbi:TdeIII family type II restriction endonuclease [Lachnospiraceae bacterium MD1]|uniref:type II site-specific deoxyribonuclease n=1 Tax=Variimorphobacter saccharofermentans TaxID=2755051 RepID=A0A839JY64_9FIRM|nr:TdeIII family type II restriction endonuclease [Variimorphobacter saccharofermentans]MBB2181421.1 TdeIII family type II restriction endonuclease [Variimorphobacter saccharofermentans]